MKHLILLIFVALSINSCNTDDGSTSKPIDKLPPKTETGENTFGYLVNGEPIVVTNSVKNITAIYQGGLLQLGGGVENKDNDIDIVILLNDPIEEDVTYNLTNLPNHRARYINFNQFEQCKYNYEDTYIGNIIFSKIDRMNYTISGTFSFSTVTHGCDDIKITNGRFDVNYIP